ncbi:MAG: prepilin-type N-terminal cleavage/methylation domain-containing protein [Desulfobacterales bacterium]|nr:MAG: prepilin-type N-terminal cleavage/methylation domain-containing protein [Desulfobacterales bacterium]
MIPRTPKMFTYLKDNRGFSMMELFVVVAIIAIVASIAISGYKNSRMSVLDATALAETRGMGKAIINVFLDADDVDLLHDPGDGANIGAKDTSDNIRTPVFVLSNGLQARIIGDRKAGVTEKGYCEAWVYHLNGSLDSTTVSGRKEYYLLVDEENKLTSFPTS